MHFIEYNRAEVLRHYKTTIFFKNISLFYNISLGNQRAKQDTALRLEEHHFFFVFYYNQLEMDITIH